MTLCPLLAVAVMKRHISIRIPHTYSRYSHTGIILVVFVVVVFVVFVVVVVAMVAAVVVVVVAVVVVVVVVVSKTSGGGGGIENETHCAYIPSMLTLHTPFSC
jgi:hypothetical protein